MVDMNVTDARAGKAPEDSRIRGPRTPAAQAADRDTVCPAPAAGPVHETKGRPAGGEPFRTFALPDLDLEAVTRNTEFTQNDVF